MLKVVDDGVEVVLTGTDGDPLFVWALALLVGAVLVALVCFTMPVPYAIGAVAVLAVLVYFFNRQKQRASTQKYHAQGILTAKPKRFAINGVGMTLTDDAQIQTQAGELIIVDRGFCYRFGGFADERELDVVRAILQGQSVAKRAVDIKMGESV